MLRTRKNIARIREQLIKTTERCEIGVYKKMVDCFFNTSKTLGISDMLVHNTALTFHIIPTNMVQTLAIKMKRKKKKNLNFKYRMCGFKVVRGKKRKKKMQIKSPLTEV